MSRSPVAFVSSLTDRCGIRQHAGGDLADVNHEVNSGGLYGQLLQTASLHGSKVAFKCLSRNVSHSYSDFLSETNKVAIQQLCPCAFCVLTCSRWVRS